MLSEAPVAWQVSPVLWPLNRVKVSLRGGNYLAPPPWDASSANAFTSHCTFWQQRLLMISKHCDTEVTGMQSLLCAFATRDTHSGAMCTLCEEAQCMKRHPFCAKCHRLMLGLRSNPAKSQPSTLTGTSPAKGTRKSSQARSRGSRSAASKPPRRRQKLPNGETFEGCVSQFSIASESRIGPGSVRTVPIADWLSEVRSKKRERGLQLPASASQEASGPLTIGLTHRRDVVAVGRAEWQKMRSHLCSLDGQGLGRLGRSHTQGWGLFATRDIPAGKLVAEYVGMVCRPALPAGARNSLFLFSVS
jgi:hypothetical protein